MRFLVSSILHKPILLASLVLLFGLILGFFLGTYYANYRLADALNQTYGIAGYNPPLMPEPIFSNPLIPIGESGGEYGTGLVVTDSVRHFECINNTCQSVSNTSTNYSNKCSGLEDASCMKCASGSRPYVKICTEKDGTNSVPVALCCALGEIGKCVPNISVPGTHIACGTYGSPTTAYPLEFRKYDFPNYRSCRIFYDEQLSTDLKGCKKLAGIEDYISCVRKALDNHDEAMVYCNKRHPVPPLIDIPIRVPGGNELNRGIIPAGMPLWVWLLLRTVTP